MEFVKVIDRKDSFITFEVKNAKERICIGDQVWMSEDLKTLELYEDSDSDVIEDLINSFVGNSKRAFRGALLRMDII